jgi:hypothetical protein
MNRPDPLKPVPSPPRWWNRNPFPLLFAIAAVGVLFAPFLLLILFETQYQLVRPQVADLLAISVVALAVPISRRIRRRKADRPGSASGVGGTIGSAVGEAIWIGCSATVFLMLLNGVLDRGGATRYVGVVSDRYWTRGGCHWDVRGAPDLPAGYSTITVDLSGRHCRQADKGDSVLVNVMPGFLGRAWILSAHPLSSRRAP